MVGTAANRAEFANLKLHSSNSSLVHVTYFMHPLLGISIFSGIPANGATKISEVFYGAKHSPAAFSEVHDNVPKKVRQSAAEIGAFSIDLA